MHLHTGWRAYVDDRQVNYDTYLDMLPAIPVHGPSKVIFRYEPRSFKTGAVLSSIGIGIFLLFVILCVKRSRNRRAA
jgi:uncharacterized membrane protein YfhO